MQKKLNMNNFRSLGLFLYSVLITSCVTAQQSGEQPKLDSISFLPTATLDRIYSISGKVNAYEFELSERGKTLKDQAEPVFGTKIKSLAELKDTQIIKELRTILLQNTTYDTSSYLPKCGFDPDFGLVFYKQEKSTKVAFMIKKNCNLISFKDEDQEILLKELTAMGRRSINDLFQKIFPESFQDKKNTSSEENKDLVGNQIQSEKNIPITSETAVSKANQSDQKTIGKQKNGKKSNNRSKKKNKVDAYYYVIKGKDDTIFSLAKKFKTSVDSIKALNPNLVAEKLKKGQKIRIH
jgi:hypothetical protein